MTEYDNPYKSLLDPEKVKNEPDFFNSEGRKEGAVSVCGTPMKLGTTLASSDAVIDAFMTIEDPEIPVNLFDLGLIYKWEQHDNGDIDVLMTLTAPNCPVAVEMPQWIGEAVAGLDGVGEVAVTLTWTPKWTKDMMSDDAKMALDFF